MEIPKEINQPNDKFSIKKERSRIAFERLQIAWIRTAITLLAFGVGAYEFFYKRIESGKSPLFQEFTGREFALILYCISFFVLLLSLLQHLRNMKKLKESYPESRISVATILSFLLLSLALFLVVFVLVKA